MLLLLCRTICSVPQHWYVLEFIYAWGGTLTTLSPPESVAYCVRKISASRWFPLEAGAFSWRIHAIRPMKAPQSRNRNENDPTEIYKIAIKFGFPFYRSHTCQWANGYHWDKLCKLWPCWKWWNNAVKVNGTVVAKDDVLKLTHTAASVILQIVAFFLWLCKWKKLGKAGK